MLWWYAAYVVGSVAAVAWYYAGLSTAEPDQPCADHDFWCGGDDIWVLKLAAIVGLIVLALSLILSWAWLRLTVSWVRPGALAGTLAAVAGPILFMLLV